MRSVFPNSLKRLQKDCKWLLSIIVLEINLNIKKLMLSTISFPRLFEPRNHDPISLNLLWIVYKF